MNRLRGISSMNAAKFQEDALLVVELFSQILMQYFIILEMKKHAKTFVCYKKPINFDRVL
jgi:hypothetical protein